MKFLVVVLFLILSGAVTADVLVFDKYDTISTVEGDHIHIDRQMTLTNVAHNPVIPGELHFKIFKQDGNTQSAIKVSGFTAANDQGQALTTKVLSEPDQTDLSVTIWDPMLPGFSYSFKVSYDLYFQPSGLLFYELKIPQEQTTIAIRNSEQTVLLGDNYHVTYAPDSSVSKVSGNVVVSWSGNNDQQVIEYSALPLPKLGIRAVNLFWGFIIVLLVGVFVISVRHRSEKNEEPPPPGG